MMDRTFEDSGQFRHICSGTWKIPSFSLHIGLKTSKNSDILYREPVGEAPSEDMKHDLYFSHVKSSWK